MKRNLLLFFSFFVLSFISTQIIPEKAIFVIFNDALSQVADWSWGISLSISKTIFKSGSASLMVTYPPNSGKWGGLYLQFNVAVEASKIQTIEFDVYPIVVPKVRICLRDPNFVQDCIANFGSTAKVNAFTRISVPITFFKGSSLQSIILQTTDDAYGQTLYIDNIYLSSAKIAPIDNTNNNATKNNTSFDNITQNNSNTDCVKNLTTQIQSKGFISSLLPAKLLLGLFLDDASPNWMKESLVPWDVQYRYLTKGWVNNWGWGNYDGSFAYNFFTKASNDGYIPAVQYYQMVGEQPWPNDESKFVAKLQTKSTMLSYFNDFIILMKQIKAFGKPVLVLMEGDGFGYCQIQSNGNNSIYAAISDTGIPELKGLPNKLYAFGLALLQIKKSVGADNALLSIHISGWASSKDLFYFSFQDPLQPEIDKIYNFLLPFGLTKNNPVGMDFDFLVNDPLDRDSDFYRLVLGGQNRWWDSSDNASIATASFNRHIEYLKLFNKKANKKWILWQIPIGNSNNKNVPNSNKNLPCEGYKDNRAEYFFGDHGLGLCHFKKYAESGVYALLFGRGEGTQASYLNDVYFDGNLFMKSRVKKNYYNFGGISLNRTSS